MTAKKKTETPRPAPEPVKIKPLDWITGSVDYSTATLAAGRDCHPGALVLPFDDNGKNKTEGG